MKYTMNGYLPKTFKSYLLQSQSSFIFISKGFWSILGLAAAWSTASENCVSMEALSAQYPFTSVRPEVLCFCLKAPPF